MVRASRFRTDPLPVSTNPLKTGAAAGSSSRGPKIAKVHLFNELLSTAF